MNPAEPSGAGNISLPAILKQLRNHFGDVLRRGHKLSKLGNIQIDVAISEKAQDTFLDETVQLGRANNLSSFAVDRSLCRDLKNIVVAMTEGIVALAVEASVLVLAQMAEMKPVGGSEPVKPGDARLHAILPSRTTST
jgi:hypothetical protein